MALNKWGRRYRRRAWEDLESSLRARARLARAPAARRRHPRRRAGARRRHDAGRRVGLAGAQRRQRAALAVPVGAGPRPGRARPGGQRAAAGDGGQAARSGGDARRSSRSCSPRSSRPTRCRGRWPATRRRASRRSACSTGSHVDLKLGAVELAADEEGRKPGGSWRVVPLVKPLHKMLREAWIAQGRPSEGKVCPPRQRSDVGDAAARRDPAAGPSRVARARAWSRSACTSRGTRRRPGSTMPASRRRSPRR